MKLSGVGTSNQLLALHWEITKITGMSNTHHHLDTCMEQQVQTIYLTEIQRSGIVTCPTKLISNADISLSFVVDILQVELNVLSLL